MPVFPANLGNNINSNEFPMSENVLPNVNVNPDFVISGSIEKNIDMTLDNCLRLALGNNPQINAAFQDILASDARIKQVWSNYFPSVSWQTSYTHIKQLQLSDALGKNLQFNYYLAGQVTLQQMLYDFGVTQNQATIKRLDYDGYKKTFEAIVNDVIYQTKDAYYNVLYAYENKRVAQEMVDKYQMFYNQAKAFYKIGMNPKVDVTIAETNLSSAKLKLIQSENAVNLAIAKLNNVMGVPYIEKYDILDKLTSSKETPGCDSGNPIESKSTKSNVGAGQSIPISNSHSSSPKAHEIEKSNVSKNIENNNYLILIIVVIIAIFALLAIGYKKK